MREPVRQLAGTWLKKSSEPANVIRGWLNFRLADTSATPVLGDQELNEDALESAFN